MEFKRINAREKEREIYNMIFDIYNKENEMTNILIGKKIRWRGKERKDVETNLYRLCTIFLL